MVRDYLSGMTAVEVGRKYGCNWSSCIRALRKSGLSPRSMSECHRKYELDETFFDIIDTEEKAYWLGFITADGSVKITNCVVITLQVGDSEHLRKFAKSIRSGHPITFPIRVTDGREYRFASIRVCSKAVVAALARHGVTRGKVHVVQPCKDVPMVLWSHYWRGVFDGDGGLEHRNRCWRVSMCGNPHIVRGFVEYITGMGISSRAKIGKNSRSTCYFVRYMGQDLPVSIVKLLYDGAAIFLDRKKRIVETMLSYPAKSLNIV